jgi:hypothetical protein
MQTQSSLVTCAACGFVAVPATPAAGAACAVCGWLDDFEQLVHPDLIYGANSGLSLRQAQSRAAALSQAKDDTAKFARDPQWRPLHADETPVDETGPSSSICYLATPDPESYVPYWRRFSRTRPRSGD